MIISHNGYPMPQNVLDIMRPSVGYELEGMRELQEDFKPSIDGKVSNLHTLEALTPAAVEFAIADIASKYGVFLLEKSEVMVIPKEITEAGQV